jgi:hypothetical protein
MPADDTLLPTLGDTATAQTLFEHDTTHAQLVILQNAFRQALSSSELRDADPPMLDVLDALTERFSNLVKHY